MSVTRIGLITPSSNTVVEPMAWRLARQLGDCDVHVTRVHVTTIDTAQQSARQFSVDAMQAAARLLAEARVDVIAWAGTSGAWLGSGTDAATEAAITATAGVPATTSYSAMLALMERLGVRRLGLWTPYEDAVQQAIVCSFAESGFAVVDEGHLGIVDNWSFAEVEPRLIVDGVRAVSRRDDVEAAVVLCTNIAAAPLVDALERELHRPVLDSLAVTLWHTLTILGASRADRVLGDETRSVLSRPPDSP